MLGHFCSSRVASSIIALQESTACSRTARSNMRSHVSITYALGAANIVAGPSRRLLNRDGSRHRCPVDGAVIVVCPGNVKSPGVGPLILCRRRRAVVESHAVGHARLAIVGITGAAIPRPLHRRSDSDGLRPRGEHVVADGNPVSWWRSVDAIVGWAGGSAAASPATKK